MTTIHDLDLSAPAESSTIEDMEQNLLFLGAHSSTGRLLVQFVEGEEAVSVEVRNPKIQARMLSLLIDGVGGELQRLREEAAGQ